MKKTIQGRVADEAMQRPETIILGGITYEVAPPTTGTLILASEAVAELPEIRLGEDTLVYDALREAKNCRPIGKAVATLILGSRRIKENEAERAETAQERKADERKCFLSKIFRNRSRYNEFHVVDDRPVVEILSEELLDNVPPSELNNGMATLLQRMQLGDFFALTTFLNAVNTTKPTRKVESKTTASGR